MSCAPLAVFRRVLSAALVAALALLSSNAVAADDKEKQLERMKARIETIRKNLDADEEQRDGLAAQLKGAELDIQSKRQDLAAARAERQASERQLSELRQEQVRTERRIADARARLAGALKMAYVGGSAEQLKLVLNQEDPAQLGRMLAYYGFLGRARAEQIATIRDRLAHLELLVEQVAVATERLKQNEVNLTERVQGLSQARQERRRQLTAIQASLRSRGGELKRLEREAAGLERLISELARAAQDFPTLVSQPFQNVRGKLPWPVNGALLARFGAPKAGGLLKWDGLLIGSSPGAQVRAPFHGNVLFADWRNGYGLLMVLDHGGGYLSIYGNLEELYRKKGDAVAPGDALGAVAEQGMDGRAALYMEIRKGKEPLDPGKWLKKK